MHRLLFAALVLVASRPAAAATPVTIDGTVYVDENRNGLLDAGEPAVAGVKVGFETAPFVTTDAAGHFTMTIAGDGVVWVQTTEDFEPAPVWKAVTLAGGHQTIELGVRRQTVTGPVRFVHGSDSHIGNGISLADERRGFDLAAAVQPRPHFLVVTGDLTDDTSDAAFQRLQEILAGIDVPFVPVVGNHDTFIAGNYVKYMGPGQYCFDQGGVRFIIFAYGSLGSDTANEMAFADRCLEGRGNRPVVAFTHMPVDTTLAQQLAAHGIDYLLTGHWHSNRIIAHGALEEVNTEAFLMGGIDNTPAGYRVVSFDGARLRYTHHTVVDETVLSIVWPREDGCVPPGDLEVVVAAEAGTTMGPAQVALDGGAPIDLVPRGGWDRTASVQVTAGNHTLVATAPSGTTAMRKVCVAAPAAAPALADWTQLQGSSAHLGVTDRRIAPPLAHLWARTVGGHLRGGSVVVAGGRVFAPVADFGDGSQGGVVALDALTGAPLWEARVGHAVQNAPAVVGSVVVFTAADGVVHAVSADTGAPLWTDDLGNGISPERDWLYAAPSAADGVVYVGISKKFAAIDAATGRELWTADPTPKSTFIWLGSYAAAGVGGGVVVASVGRGPDGVVAWDALDGRELWRVPPPLSVAVQGGVLIDGDQAFLTNSATDVYALDLLAPAPPKYAQWMLQTGGSGSDFTYGIFGTPALAADRLIVPTMLGETLALDRKSGAVLWRHDGAPGSIRATHLKGAGQAAFAGSPVVTGDLVWIGGVDGSLTALDLDSGQKSWSEDLGAPVLSGVVPAGDLLLVGTYDGTVHALVHAAGPTCPDAPGCAKPGGGGCAIAPAAGGGFAWAEGLLVGVAGVTAGRWRRRRRTG